MAPPPPRRRKERPRPEVQDRPVTRNLLDDLLVEPAKPTLAPPPTLAPLPSLAAMPTLAPMANLAAMGASTLKPRLAAPSLRALQRGDLAPLDDRIAERMRIVNNVVVVVPPPKAPLEQLWWMPFDRYRQELLDPNVRVPHILLPNMLIDIDMALGAMAQRQQEKQMLQWKGDEAPVLFADAIADEKEALVGWPDGDFDVEEGQEEKVAGDWYRVMLRYAELREEFFDNPQWLEGMGLHRYKVLDYVSDWFGLRPGTRLTWNDVVNSGLEAGGRAHSMWAAAVDYITWNHSSWLGAGGKELAAYQCDVELFDREKWPKDNMFFAQFHSGSQQERSTVGDRVAVRGGYGVAKVSYVSAAGLMGDQAPPGVPAWRQVVLVPLDSEQPRHVCRVDCREWFCSNQGAPLWEEPPEDEYLQYVQ